MTRLFALLPLVAGALATMGGEALGEDSGVKVASGGDQTTSPEGGGEEESIELSIGSVKIKIIGSSDGEGSWDWQGPKPGENATIHQVTVGDMRDGQPFLGYEPPSLDAAPGEYVQFNFKAMNHTLTQSTLEEPCVKMEGGMDSGFMPNPDNTMPVPPSMMVEVNDTNPMWFYCKQGDHCSKGMAFGLNPGGPEKMEEFMNNAKSQNGSAADATNAVAAANDTAEAGADGAEAGGEDAGADGAEAGGEDAGADGAEAGAEDAGADGAEAGGEDAGADGAEADAEDAGADGAEPDAEGAEAGAEGAEGGAEEAELGADGAEPGADGAGGEGENGLPPSSAIAAPSDTPLSDLVPGDSDDGVDSASQLNANNGTSGDDSALGADPAGGANSTSGADAASLADADAASSADAEDVEPCTCNCLCDLGQPGNGGLIGSIPLPNDGTLRKKSVTF